MVNFVGQAPIIEKDFNNRHWKDWFARLNDFLDVQDVIIFRETVTTQFAITSPVLEPNYIYEVHYLLKPNPTNRSILIQVEEGGSWITTGYTVNYVLFGTGVSGSSSGISLIAVNQTSAQEAVGTFRIYNARNSAELTRCEGAGQNYDWGVGKQESMIYGGRRNSAVDATRFRITASGSNTITGTAVCRRVAFEP